MMIRHARADEARLLTSLAWLAKSHWGYSRQVMEAWREALSLTPDSITREPTWVAHQGRANDSPIAVVQIGTSHDPWEIECLWVHPDHMGRGLGRALIGRVIEHARLHRQRQIVIDADPNAEGFYLAIGARRVGEVSAPLPGAAGRVRPQLVLQVPESARDDSAC